jgi:hypothetical protein
MPTADRYARYRADQTTIWVSKTAAAFLARERTGPTDGAAAVLDRLLAELRRLRREARAAGREQDAAEPAARSGAKRARRRS